MVSKDILWKGIIEDLFEDFLWYCLPTLAKTAVDFTQPFEFLDKELDALAVESERGKRHADKLVKFYLKSGQACYALLHIEVQGYNDTDFAKRMFEYYYRISDKWNLPVCTFVLYTDEATSYHPTQYVSSFHGTEIVFKFNTFELCTKTTQELDLPNNPFSIVMKVAQKNLEAQQLKDEAQLVWKMELVRELYKAGFERSKIQHIFDFIRLYVRFEKPEKELELEEKLESITKPSKPMGIREAVMTEIQRIGEEKGKKEAAFGMFAEGLPVEAVARITKLPLATIEAWQKEWETTK
jgi:predicted transposase/invertase (TIGR01784 family)